MPNINEDDGIPCADYKYYPSKGTQGYFLEEKETNGKGKNVFYHAFEDSQVQANIFLLDCTDSNLIDYEIIQRLERVFNSYKTKYVEFIILKNNQKLFGVYKKRSDLSGYSQWDHFS